MFAKITHHTLASKVWEFWVESAVVLHRNYGTFDG